jgi:hypothetical protein
MLRIGCHLSRLLDTRSRLRSGFDHLAQARLHLLLVPRAFDPTVEEEFPHRRERHQFNRHAIYLVTHSHRRRFVNGSWPSGQTWYGVVLRLPRSFFVSLLLSRVCIKSCRIVLTERRRVHSWETGRFAIHSISSP